MARLTILRGVGRISKGTFTLVRDATHLPSPPHGLLRFGRNAALHTELVRDPFRQEELLDLAVGEGIRKIADEANSELDRALRPLGVRQTPPDELKHRGDVRQEQVDLRRVLETGDDAGVRLENGCAHEADALDKIDAGLDALVSSE